MRATAMDLVNAIRINGSVMIIEDDEVIEVDRCVQTRDAIFFEGVKRDGDSVKFDVATAKIGRKFVTTTKAATNWPW